MFEQVFKNIDDIRHKDAGCSSKREDLDFIEKTTSGIKLTAAEKIARM